MTDDAAHLDAIARQEHAIPPTIYDDRDTGRLRVEFPPGTTPEHLFPVAGTVIAGWVDQMNTYADMRQLQLRRMVLTPVQVFGADCSAHPDSECCAGYGLMDAVGPGWSDCNRAIGRIYRVEDLDSDRFLQDEGKQARVEVWARTADLPFFDARHGDDLDDDQLLTRIEIGDPTPPVEGTELTPEQLLHRFVTGTPGERIDYLRRMMQLARQADQCVMQNHAGAVEELTELVRVVGRYHAALEAIGSDHDSTDRIRDAVGRALYPET